MKGTQILQEEVNRVVFSSNYPSTRKILINNLKKFANILQNNLFTIDEVLAWTFPFNIPDGE